MRAEGGPAQRMTWLGPDVMVRGWTPEGHILFVTTYGQPLLPQLSRLYARSAGATPQLLELRSGEPPGVRPRQREADRPQHRRSGALEALSRRNRRAFLDRCVRSRDVSPDDRAQRATLTSPMWIGFADLLPVRRRRRRQSLFVPARWIRRAASQRPRPTTMRATRKPTARASSINAAPTSGCSTRRRIEPRASTSTFRRIARRRRASSCRLPDHLGAIHVHPAGHSVARRRARQGVHVPAVGRRGSPARGHRRRPLPASPQWLDDGTTLVAIGDGSGEERVEVFEDGVTRTLPWDVGRVVAMRAAPRGRRVAIANHRNEVLIGDVASGDAHGDRSQRCRSHRGSRLVARRRVARLLVLDEPAALRDQAPRR